MKNIMGFLIFVQISGISFTNAVAQGEAGKFGFGVSAQQPTVALTVALMGRYWMVCNIAFDVRFGFSTNDQNVFVIGGSLLKTLGGAEKVYSYFGGKLDIINEDKPGGDTTVSLGGILGAEYFVVSRFSVLGESQFLIEFNGGASVGTQTTLSVLFYLN